MTARHTVREKLWAQSGCGLLEVCVDTGFGRDCLPAQWIFKAETSASSVGGIGLEEERKAIKTWLVWNEGNGQRDMRWLWGILEVSTARGWFAGVDIGYLLLFACWLK